MNSNGSSPALMMLIFTIVIVVLSAALLASQLIQSIGLCKEAVAFNNAKEIRDVYAKKEASFKYEAGTQ